MNIIEEQEILSGEIVNLLHLDRLQVTMRHHPSSTFQNIINPSEIDENQIIGDFELRLNNKRSEKHYYHCFDVNHEGIRIGKLSTASKFGKPEVEFEFEKRVLYSNYDHWWFDLIQEMMSKLGLTYNNIKYVEIALDTIKNIGDLFRQYYYHSNNYKFADGVHYKHLTKQPTHILNDGSNFLVAGGNAVSIYNKSANAEDYILDFFKANGFNGDVYRCESRLNWNYIRSFMQKKNVMVDLSTLKDKEMLAQLFLEAVKSKLTFLDLNSKHYDQNRNVKYDKIFILSDISLNTKSLVEYLPIQQSSHYSNPNVNEEIFRKLYFQFIETGKNGFLQAITAAAIASEETYASLSQMKKKFDKSYNGSRTKEKLDRMVFAEQWFNPPELNADERMIFQIWEILNDAEVPNQNRQMAVQMV